MKHLGSPRCWISRVGLAAALGVLAGVLLAVTLAVSAEPAHPPAGSAPAASELSAPLPGAQANQAAPGDVITYTLVYSNAGVDLATGVVISDPLPAEILAPGYQATGRCSSRRPAREALPGRCRIWPVGWAGRS